ncbi:pyridoxamine 5'-phosphate oxidase family protein [Ruania albidiflava]|uniref:pyridoxamine 5'-phosphate oxidase family protein n=1 Tax=Ruania albidiflava TaxID=366586 RepID=UPI0023F3BF0E|nr:pyridoxamine 5'-phosphate oxidase family protein [Ruania albidiflava]
MLETPEEITALHELMDRSYAGASAHLRDIVDGDRRMDAAGVLTATTGMRVLSLATVTAAGEPRISAVDGHFLHGTWTFGTAGDSLKARHLATRPAVSLAHVDGERCGIFAHGYAHQLRPIDAQYAETIAHWTAHYGSDPTSWGPDVRIYRVELVWLVGYATTTG